MSRPPAVWRLLARLLPLGAHRGDILADLDEVYARHLERGDRRSAARRYRREVFALAGWTSRGLFSARTLRRAPTTHGPGENPVAGILHDFRFGLRSLRRQPGYSLLALATLALGTGAVTVMFSLVQGVLLSPLPVREPDRLMIVWEVNPRGQQTIASAANYVDWLAQNDVFAHMALVSGWGPTLSGVDEPRRLSGLEVTADFLKTVGLEPLYGRDFRDDEDDPGAAPVVILSEGLWRDSFAADPGVVGSDIELSSGTYTVIGVAPAALGRTGLGGDILVPVILREGDWLEYRGRHSVTVVGRLAPGVSEEAAQAQMDGIAAALEQQHPDTNEGYGVDVEPMKAALTDTAEQPLTLLLAAVAMLLLIACANVANLTMARAVSRRAELAVCAALGAGRWRLVQRLMVENGALALGGGLLGLGGAYALIDAVVAFVPASVPRLYQVSMNGAVLAFAAGATALTLLLAGVLPALRTGGSALPGAMAGTAGRITGGRGERVIRDGLVVAEMALAVVLLVGAGLFLRSLAALNHVELGVRQDGVMTLRTYLPGERYTDPARARSLLRDILRQVRALPGVDAAAIASHLPLANQGMNSGIRIFGRPEGGTDGPSASFRVVSPGYFEALGIPLLRGRDFTDDDIVGAPLVVAVNQEFADRYFADAAEPALGHRIGYRVDADGNDIYAEIVAVVGNVHHFGPGLPPVAEVYEPLGQTEETLRWFGRSVAIVARSSGDPAPLGPALRDIVRRADPDLPVSQVQRLGDFLERRTARPRFQARLLSLFAALAVLLAGIGVYGVLSLQVRSRVREIGLRQALGADRALVVRGVVATGLRLAAAGALLGGATALALSRFVDGLLFGVDAHDPLVYLLTPLLLSAIAALACWLPALRAARVDPAVALRR